MMFSFSNQGELMSVIGPLLDNQEPSETHYRLPYPMAALDFFDSPIRRFLFLSVPL
jgi:hypothetical protein